MRIDLPYFFRALFHCFENRWAMQVYIMKLISTILIASTAAALKAPRAAPMKALQVPRCGGMVEKSTALTVTKAPCRVLARARPRRGRD